MTKNLIILGAIIFSFALTNSVSAYYNNYAFSASPTSYPVNYQYNPYTQTNPYPMNQGYPQNGYYQQYPQQVNPVVVPVTPQYNYYQPQPYYVPVTQVVTVPVAVPANLAFQPATTTKPTTSTVNNYYYQTAPATVAKTTTTTDTSNTTTNRNTTTDTNGVSYNNSGYSNSLGASAYNGYNGITALSLRGSGSFMPSSIWQWMLVIVLILAIIVISRIIIRKPVVIQETHTVPTH